MVHRKKRARVLRRSLSLAFGIILFLMIGIYIFFGVYFRSHFFIRPVLKILASVE